MSNEIPLKEYVDEKLKDLKELIDAKFSNVSDAVNTALISADKATLKAEQANEKRFESMNAFHDAVKAHEGKFATRDDIKPLQTMADVAEGKASQNAVMFFALISIAGVVLGIINLIWKR